MTDFDQRAQADVLAELARWFAPSPLDALTVVPEPPDDAPVNRRLTTLDISGLAPLPAPLPVDVVRAQILTTLHDYANTKKHYRLLVSAPAGIGKSHQGIQFVQERAALGERWLWAAQNHAMFDDLAGHENFDPALWYHWQPIDGEINAAPACKYPLAQQAWTERGYRAWNLCRQLCGRKDNWKDPNEITYMDSCPYRTQKRNAGAIVFCMHQHLYSGLDAGDFDGVVVDESFIGLIARERYVRGKDIKQTEINLAVIQLADALTNLWGEIRAGMKPAYVAGKLLLDAIGDIYPNAAIQLQVMASAPELKAAGKRYRNPAVTDPNQVQNLQTIYMDDLCTALYPEYRAWAEGKSVWAERVWLDRDGLHFVTPAPLWADLPKRVVVLDATGGTDFYQRAFGGAVEEYWPSVTLLGKIYQITGRQNGKGMAMTKTKAKQPRNSAQKYDTELSRHALEFVEVAKQLISMRNYKNVAVITFQQVEKMIAEALGLDESRAMHFYKLRGRNDLQGCDCMFIYGTPSPQERTVTNIMLALDPHRIEPIYETDAAGRRKPIYVPRQMEFRLSAAGLALWQATHGETSQGAARVVGSYRDPMAAAIQAQMREAELLQAINRARPITNPCDVWVFSSVATEEALDGLFDDPPIAPGRLSWKLWLKICAWYKTLPKHTPYNNETMAAGIGVREDYLRSLQATHTTAKYFDDEIESAIKTEGNVKEGRKRTQYRVTGNN